MVSKLSDNFAQYIFFGHRMKSNQVVLEKINTADGFDLIFRSVQLESVIQNLGLEFPKCHN